ncbi:uncharacterized protein LOC127865077 [Dreissena polymorpha]|uniref:Uncharacterized protein n=1 Tax=Dreissena polymorpha TaxID=45954 RepID=A0A9D4RVS9_DREPO|nr:uncharacterized protein LOC127865077 [Dreissena polymorpha]XP_052260927.1 uncharacterized protein LOC127865077 [Dreissena polymorpha]KAH3880663.1 hypothetical protein DPMN_004584 [Dreissena polymorpha]
MSAEYDETAPRRRRKRTIVAYSHPDIKSVETEMSHVKERSANEAGSKIPDRNHMEDRALGKRTSIEKSRDHSDVNGEDSEKEHGINGTLSGLDNVMVNPPGSDGDTYFNEGVVSCEKDARQAIMETEQVEVNQNRGETGAMTSIVNDIVYDETKPKRLAHPNHLKVHIDPNNEEVLRESINYLISPTSPNRQRKRSYLSAGETTEKDNHALKSVRPQNKVKKDVKHAGDQQSPEVKSSNVLPCSVQLLKNDAAEIVHANAPSRKISLDAKLEEGYSIQEVLNKGSPLRRKISSDARLQHPITEQITSPVESTKTRRVSFGTSTLVNGIQLVPLNDQPKTVHEEPEHMLEHTADETTWNDTSLGARPKQITRISETEQEHTEQDDYSQDNVDNEGTMVRRESEISFSEGEEDYFVNRANVADDEDSLRGAHSSAASTPPPSYHEYTNDRLKRLPRPENKNHINNDTVDIVSHQMTKDPYKLSTCSLPATFERRESSDSLVPKSILKTRSTDCVSLVSEDSFAPKPLKIRKDSIALFLDHNGAVAMQEMRDQYNHRRLKFFTKSNIKQLWSERKQLLEQYKLHLLVLGLFLLTFTFVVIGLHFHSAEKKYLETSQKVFFDGTKRTLTINDIDGLDTFSGTLGLDIPMWKNPTHCYPNYAEISDKTCLSWKEHGRLDIAHFVSQNTQCYNVTWKMLEGTYPFDCYNLGDGHWFGPMNKSESKWPIQDSAFTFTVNKAKHHESGTFSSAVEYYWISSKGETVVVDSNYPVEISWNTRRSGSFCVIGKNNGDFFLEGDDMNFKTFAYTVCNGVNMMDTHRYIRQRYFPKITEMPGVQSIEFPHWSTEWDSDTITLNDTIIENLATLLALHKLNCSSIEIDGKWEANIGDITFNEKFFDNLTDTFSIVKKAGCQLSLNVFPFFSYNSLHFQELALKDFLIRDVGGTVPALLKWEHGVGAMLDVSNPLAREWFSNKIRNLSETYDIRTFRLAYGTSSWVPHKPVFHVDHLTPNQLKHMFSDMVSDLGNSIVESTSQSQHISTLLGIPSSVVEHGNAKCLKNIIPDVLNLGIMGYPFVLSDGFEVDPIKADRDKYPSMDLYIRWMQLSAFLPAVRYTIKPWEYDKSVIQQARYLSKLHSETITKVIYETSNATLNGDPIIQPMWWNNTGDETSFTIDDQFIVAGKYLVAPILCESSEPTSHVVRDIYIPAGVWRDVFTEKAVIGPMWLKSYKVPQFQIPYFERIPLYSSDNNGDGN